MPGGQLTDVVDDDNFKGKVAVKLGPVSLSFAGTVKVTERDDAEHRIVLKAQGMEQRGKGSASAVVTAWAEARDGGTQVKYSQDITVTGAVAQFSRGMMQDVSGRLTKQFADCLNASLSSEQWPFVERLGVHSLLYTPISVRGSVTGVIITARRGPGHPYTEEDDEKTTRAPSRAAASNRRWEARRLLRT